MRWRARGDWRQAGLTRRDISVVVAALVSQVAFRGWDYALGDADDVQSLALIERAAPLRWWTAVIALALGVLLFGAALRRHALVWLGHGLLAVIYLVLLVGLALPALGRPYWDGIREATVLLTPMTCHALLWLRTGPRPPDVSNLTPVESVGRPTNV